MSMENCKKCEILPVRLWKVRQFPLKFSPRKILRYIPSTMGYIPPTSLHKSRFIFMHLYYSYRRLLYYGKYGEAESSHDHNHGEVTSPSSSQNHMIIIIVPAATASPSPHNAKLPSSLAPCLALPSPADDKPTSATAVTAAGSCSRNRRRWHQQRWRHYVCGQ